MDHTYGLSELETRHSSTISMARSMRVAKERNLVERDDKPRKQRKRALVAVSILSSIS
jgi:hypothetical protein